MIWIENVGGPLRVIKLGLAEQNKLGIPTKLLDDTQLADQELCGFEITETERLLVELPSSKRPPAKVLTNG